MNKGDNAQELLSVPKMSEQERLRYARLVAPERIKAGLTQQELAEMANVSRNSIGGMESGRVIPQADKLYRVMRILGIAPQSEDPEWLTEWWAIIRPMALSLTQEQRGIAMGKIIQILSEVSDTRESQREPASITSLNSRRDRQNTKAACSS